MSTPTCPLEGIVDLKSYSASSGFIGYFSYKGRDIKEGGKLAIAALGKNIDEQAGVKIIAMSTLKLDAPLDCIKEDFNYSNYEFDTYLNPLIAANFVVDDEAGDGFRTFHINPLNKELLQKACYVQLALGGLAGHLFILFEDEGILIYPHDDAGFGAIRTKESNSLPRIFELINPELFNIRLGV